MIYFYIVLATARLDVVSRNHRNSEEFDHSPLNLPDRNLPENSLTDYSVHKHSLFYIEGKSSRTEKKNKLTVSPTSSSTLSFNGL